MLTSHRTENIRLHFSNPGGRWAGWGACAWQLWGYLWEGGVLGGDGVCHMGEMNTMWTLLLRERLPCKSQCCSWHHFQVVFSNNMANRCQKILELFSFYTNLTMALKSTQNCCKIIRVFFRSSWWLVHPLSEWYRVQLSPLSGMWHLAEDAQCQSQPHLCPASCASSSRVCRETCCRSGRSGWTSLCHLLWVPPGPEPIPGQEPAVPEIRNPEKTPDGQVLNYANIRENFLKREIRGQEKFSEQNRRSRRAKDWEFLFSGSFDFFVWWEMAGDEWQLSTRLQFSGGDI